MKYTLLLGLFFWGLVFFSQEADRFTVKLLDINSPDNEFGTVIEPGGGIFYSRSHAKATKDLEETSAQLYKGQVGVKMEIENGLRFPTDAIHAIFSNDGNTVYYSKEQKGKFQLFRAYIDSSGRWKNNIKLPFCNAQYSYKQPTLNQDNTKLYFVSDMPDSYGGTDVYYVAIEEKGMTFSAPVHLSYYVNSSGNEIFPSVGEKDKLFFASDGLGGLGGYDIFESFPEEGKYVKTSNLGAPINSSSDEIAYTLVDGHKGYFTSNRSGGRGGYDIYSFKDKKPSLNKCSQSISGFVKNKKNFKPIFEATIEVFNSSGPVGTYLSNVKGFFVIDNVECEENYDLVAYKEGYNGFVEVQTKPISAKELELFLDPELPEGFEEEFDFSNEVVALDPVTEKPLENQNIDIPSENDVNAIVDVDPLDYDPHTQDKPKSNKPIKEVDKVAEVVDYDPLDYDPHTQSKPIKNKDIKEEAIKDSQSDIALISEERERRKAEAKALAERLKAEREIKEQEAAKQREIARQKELDEKAKRKAEAEALAAQLKAEQEKQAQEALAAQEAERKAQEEAQRKAEAEALAAQLKAEQEKEAQEALAAQEAQRKAEAEAIAAQLRAEQEVKEQETLAAQEAERKAQEEAQRKAEAEALAAQLKAEQEKEAQEALAAREAQRKAEAEAIAAQLRAEQESNNSQEGIASQEENTQIDDLDQNNENTILTEENDVAQRTLSAHNLAIELMQERYNTGDNFPQILGSLPEKNAEIAEVEPEKCARKVTGTVLNSVTKEEINDVFIDMFYDGQNIETTQTNRSGIFNFHNVDCNLKFTLICYKEGFDNIAKAVIKTDREVGIMTILLEPNPDEEVVENNTSDTLSESLISKDVKTPAVSDQVATTNEDKEVTEEVKTNEVTEIVYEYPTKGDNEKPLVDQPYTQYEDIEEPAIEKGKVMLNPIYFDLDEHYLTLSARRELDKIIVLLRNNPTLIIESGSHTDSRGPFDYNLKLSEKRSQEAVGYLIANGADPDRISGRGYGESIPVNQCVDGVKCSDKEHLQNRRTEFVVLRY
jgi:outer membrane protein OmpA-like peptidoglycan-associated protein